LDVLSPYVRARVSMRFMVNQGSRPIVEMRYQFTIPDDPHMVDYLTDEDEDEKDENISQPVWIIIKLHFFVYLEAENH
jgi:hypothetical protein